MKREIILDIPYTIPSLNEWERTHHQKKPKLKRSLGDAIRMIYRTECINAGLVAEFPVLDSRITIHSFRRKLITDRDNFEGGMKCLKDALTYSGLIRDDNRKDFCEGEHTQAVDYKNPRTVIVVEGDFKSRAVAAKERTSSRGVDAL